jgi:hypothetical protein
LVACLTISNSIFLEVLSMPKRIATVDFRLRTLFRRLAGNLMIVVVFVTMVIGLAHFNAVVPQPGAVPELSDAPGSGLIVRSEVIHLWLPESLVDPARNESPSLVTRTHQELIKALDRRGQENLWYAITVRAYLANDRSEDMSFIRHPYRQLDHLQELTDIVATVVGIPPRHPSADYSAAVVHIMPARMSQREWLQATQASSLLRQAVPLELEPIQ